MENEYIEKSALQTPCFVFNEDIFIKNITNFKQKLDKYFIKNIMGYSFKTNSLPRLLYLAKENGCFAEVVSDDEYLLAQEIGFESERIIFNGPIKGESLFIEAIRDGSLINIDSAREIEWLLNINPVTEINIGIRVNIDLEKKLPGQSSTGKCGGRFGFCYENGELHKAIERIKGISNIRIDRLHMHISNATKSTDIYKCLADTACEIMKMEQLDISYVDFGGGYFGGGDDGEAYEKYAKAIYNTLVKCGYANIGVIVEPGASVVATAFDYLTKVIDKKETTYGRFVVTDGTRLHIDPFLRKEKFCYSCIPQRNGEKVLQTICGYTCMENDRIMNIFEEELEVGDTIEYRIVGSYSMCFNSLFINYLPCVYGKTHNEKFRVLREKWGVKEFIQRNRWQE